MMNASAARLGTRPAARAIEICRCRSRPSTRISAERPGGEIGFDGSSRDERRAVPGLHSASHRLLEPEHELDIQVAEALALAAQLVFEQLTDTRALLHEDERISASSSTATVRPAERCPGGQTRITSSEKNGSNSTSAAAPGGADDAELELTLRDERDDGLRVVHGQANVERRIRLVELAKEERHDDRRRSRRCADLERAGQAGRRPGS